MHHQYRIVSKQLHHLKKKIAPISEVHGVTIDDEAHDDMKVIASNCSHFIDDLPADSFRRIFWEQQLEAASLKDARSMRWHPQMIRWCLYLRHR